MSYFGKHLGRSHGFWFGTLDVVAQVRHYILRLQSHVRKTVVLASRLF
jgi:hypothetical protein